VNDSLRRRSAAADVLFSVLEGNWNTWRSRYNELDINDLIFIHAGYHFYSRCQAHYDFKKINEVLWRIIKNRREVNIIELGCWRGHLASEILSTYTSARIKSYTGYDIDFRALDSSVVKSKRYKSVKMTDWFYNLDFKGDILISSHTLEHFDEEQVNLLFDELYTSSINFVIVELPFSSKKWENYGGSHVLSLGKNDFVEMIITSGFSKFYEERSSKGYVFGWMKV
jgi:hypothetical protein